MELSIPTIVTNTDRQSRKNSLRESIALATSPARKDSVTPFVNRESSPVSSAKSSVAGICSSEAGAGADRTRRLSRRLSLRPPTNVYREKRFSGPHAGHVTKATSGNHSVTCECGRKLQVPCDALTVISRNDTSTSLSKAEATDLKRAFENNQKNASQNDLTDGTSSPSLQVVVDTMKTKSSDYDAVLQACQEMAKLIDHDSLEAVLSRQAAITCLLDAIKNYPDKGDLHLEVCKSLLQQIKKSEASLHYLAINDGIERLHSLMKMHSENTTILAHVLDIFGYISSNEEWRGILSEKVNHSAFLTTMARHDSNVTVVQKCCVVVSNLVISEDLARSLMYVGGVHSIISMMNKYSSNIDILKHCCNALGTFASHDDTCQAVAEAGATNAVMTAMTSFPDNADVQESCCWALASLSRTAEELFGQLKGTLGLSQFWLVYVERQRQLMMSKPRSRSCFISDCACMELVYSDAFAALMKCMQTYPHQLSIQEYGCWALCNLTVLGSRLEDTVARTTLEILIQNIAVFTNTHHVELLEHICYAINTFVSTTDSVHEIVVTRNGVSRLIELMRTFEENVEIHTNGMKVLGNLAVNTNFRRYIEDMGASEAVISCMLKHDHNVHIQTIGCIALTNISADIMDNKYRVLKNGGVHAVLQAMKNAMDTEAVQLNGLKLLCNLLESDKGCWWIAEECGVDVISMTLKTFQRSELILTFGCTCLASIPRRGINVVVMESVESTLLYLRQSMSTDTDVAVNVLNFYQNVLDTGKECKRVFTRQALQTVLSIIQDFDDIIIQRAGCRIIAQVAIADDLDLLSREVTSQLITSMRNFMQDSSIQILGCGAISFLSSSDTGLELLKDLGCIEIVLESMKTHQNVPEVQTVAMSALQNISKADLIRGKTIQSVCDAISRSLKANPDNDDIQLEGCHILSYIGNSFHKQNEKRRKSLDVMEVPAPSGQTSPRKSVTDEIMGVDSAALQRLMKFKDGVMETENEEQPGQGGGGSVDVGEFDITELETIPGSPGLKPEPEAMVPLEDIGTGESTAAVSENGSF